MTWIPTVVIGAGHAGLAMSHELTRLSIDHVVLERGEVANTWRNERWDSLRLLTPNWQTRLPGLSYDGDDPDGFMTMPEVIDFIERYSRRIDAPVVTNTTVESVRRGVVGFEVQTESRVWETQAVVLATGAFNLPKLPPVSSQLPASVDSVTAHEYRSPAQLPDGGVLVVGASATGVQIADELAGAGMAVTLAVGEHVRLPRIYRGEDIFFWFDETGLADERYDEVDDIVRARHVPSPQLVGTDDRQTLDLNELTAKGVQLVGRLSGVADGVAQFSGSLRNVCALADLKLGRLLDTIDEWVTDNGLDDDIDSPERLAPTVVDDEPRLSIDLAGGEVESVIWATGYQPDYTWLHLPVLDRKGEIRHDGGIVPESPGLYRIGSNFLRRRKSSFIHGAEDDACDLAEHLAAYLNASNPNSASSTTLISEGRAGIRLCDEVGACRPTPRPGDGRPCHAHLRN